MLAEPAGGRPGRARCLALAEDWGDAPAAPCPSHTEGAGRMPSCWPAVWAGRRVLTPAALYSPRARRCREQRTHGETQACEPFAREGSWVQRLGTCQVCAGPHALRGGREVPVSNTPGLHRSEDCHQIRFCWNESLQGLVCVGARCALDLCRPCFCSPQAVTPEPLSSFSWCLPPISSSV